MSEYTFGPVGAIDNFEAWIYDENDARVIQKNLQTSAVELVGRPEPMGAAVKRVPRGGGFTVAAVAKGGTYAVGTTSNDDIELVARKVGGSEQISDEDLNDPKVDVLLPLRRAAATALATFFDNACLGTSAAGNGTTVLYDSVLRAVRTNGDASSIESSYTADDNYATATKTNFVATLSGATTGYGLLSDWLAKYEESEFFDEENSFVVAHPKLKNLLRNVKDGQGNPMLVPLGTVNDRPSYGILGYQTIWSRGARVTAVSTQNPTTGNPLLIIGNREHLIRGDAQLQPWIPASAPGFAFQTSANGAGFDNDTGKMKAAIRRGFKVGIRPAFSVLEISGA